MVPKVTTIDVDTKLDAVGHVERRRLLYALLEEARNGGAVLEFERLHIGSNGGERAASLWHRHLPKLEEGGFVVVDVDRKRVETGARFDALVPLLDHLAASGAEPSVDRAVTGTGAAVHGADR